MRLQTIIAYIQLQPDKLKNPLTFILDDYKLQIIILETKISRKMTNKYSRKISSNVKSRKIGR